MKNFPSKKRNDEKLVNFWAYKIQYFFYCFYFPYDKKIYKIDNIIQSDHKMFSSCLVSFLKLPSKIKHNLYLLTPNVIFILKFIVESILAAEPLNLIRKQI